MHTTELAISHLLMLTYVLSIHNTKINHFIIKRWPVAIAYICMCQVIIGVAAAARLQPIYVAMQICQTQLNFACG